LLLQHHVISVKVIVFSSSTPKLITDIISFRKQGEIMLKAWLFLILAITSEVFSVVFMKMTSHSDSLSSLALMYLTIIISFTLMALALKRIPLSVAYATWESIGLICVAAIGLFLFNEAISPFKAVALIMLVAGVILVNTGEHENGHTDV
uniref:DMT family transporter n=2 Tax=Enterobacterales TaxID=91347 RepID=UPI003D6EC07C